jgi:uncharacterized protein YbjT (DUF2867 family)
MKNVLIAGASGYLGKYVAKEFKKQGYIVHALVRNLKKVEDIDGFIDHVVTAEVTDKSSLEGVCKGIDVVFSSVGITKQKDKLTYHDVDYQANQNLLLEAEKEGVSKFIYVSVFNANSLIHLKCIEAKHAFEASLKRSGINYTIMYPNGFFSDMLEYLQMAEKGKGFVFGDGENRINPIHGADLAAACVDAVVTQDHSIEIGGPDILTHNEILKLAFDVRNKPIQISKVPNWVNKIALGFLRLFTPVKFYGPLEFFMTVLSVDMIAPKHGSCHLKDFFIENAKKSLA